MFCRGNFKYNIIYTHAVFIQTENGLLFYASTICIIYEEIVYTNSYLPKIKSIFSYWNYYTLVLKCNSTEKVEMKFQKTV